MIKLIIAVIEEQPIYKMMSLDYLWICNAISIYFIIYFNG